MSFTEDFYFNETYPPLLLKDKTKKFGRVWRIKVTIGQNYNVYKPHGKWTAKFNWRMDAEEFIKTQMEENDVIAYN